MSLFGNSNSASLFGQPNQNQQQQQQPASTNIFGLSNPQQNQNQQSSASGLFGPPTTQQKPSLFASLNTNTSQPQQSGGLFGPPSQPAQSGGLFAPASQPQQTGGLFGNSQPAQGGGGGSSLFGASQPQQQQAGGLFGSSQPQQQQTGGLFGSLGQSTNQQPQQQAPQQQNSVLGQSSNQSRLFQASDLAPRQKSVIDQVELTFSKWNPVSAVSPFRTYLYNAVPKEQVHFYGPSGLDDEAKWEEALEKRPMPGSVPVLCRGYEELGARMRQQVVSLQVLHGRLHEINTGLNDLLQKHTLQISIRAAECKRRHQVLAKQCLHLAAKTQVLRNRGFALDGAEEALRQKLLVLERGVLDPALNGRSEEIWARMVSVRERSRHLQRELERSGDAAAQGGGIAMDEEVMKRAKKILEDYSSQLAHLSKEVIDIQKDWVDWESTGKANGDIGGRR